MNGLSKHGLVFWFLAPAFIAFQLAILAVLIDLQQENHWVDRPKNPRNEGRSRGGATGGPPTLPGSMTGRVETPSRAPEKPTSPR